MGHSPLPTCSNSYVSLISYKKVSSGCRDKQGGKSVPPSPLQEASQRTRASQLGEPVQNPFMASRTGCGTPPPSPLTTLSRLLPSATPRWRPSQYSGATWAQTCCRREALVSSMEGPISQKLSRTGRAAWPHQQEAGGRLPGEGPRAGLIAVCTLETQSFLPLSPASLGVKLAAPGEGRDGT